MAYDDGALVKEYMNFLLATDAVDEEYVFGHPDNDTAMELIDLIQYINDKRDGKLVVPSGADNRTLDHLWL